MTARSGDVVAFDDVWRGRQKMLLVDGVHVNLPSLDDLIRTKRLALRSKDLEDIRMLEILKTRPVTPADIEALRAFAERELTEEEIAQYLGASVTEDERRGVLDVVEWFCRRYPTPLARLPYVTGAPARWHATHSWDSLRSWDSRFALVRLAAPRLVVGTRSDTSDLRAPRAAHRLAASVRHGCSASSRRNDERARRSVERHTREEVKRQESITEQAR